MTGTEPHAWGTGLMDDITFVGLDVHKATVCIAVAEGGRGGEVRQLGVFENRPEILNKVVSRLSNGGRRLSFCYEAGPCGYGLHRLLTGYEHECIVVAPSLIPMKAGDRVKTDRRDALMLAKLNRAGELGREGDRQDDLIVTWADMPRSPGHVFYDRLQGVLIAGGFDAFVEKACQPYYAPKMGAPSVPPGRYFRMHMIGYFEGIASERGIAWRCSD